MSAAPTRNLHTHTWRCKHASGTVAEYAAAALADGGRVLGITDHTPLPDGRWAGVRMDLAALPDYLAEIEAARRQSPGLKLLAGMECEYVPEFQSFYEDELLGTHGLDYLIGGCHAFPFQGEWIGPHGYIQSRPERLRAYADYVIEAMGCGLFAFYAHPDVFGCSYLPWDADAASCARDICQAAVALNMPLEINGYGLRKGVIETPGGPRHQYPLLPFWEIAAECGVRYVATSDAHRPQDVLASIPDCHELARRFGLQQAELPAMFDA
jgi:histidinol-phosphatase (PHP family)